MASSSDFNCLSADDKTVGALSVVGGIGGPEFVDCRWMDRLSLDCLKSDFGFLGTGSGIKRIRRDQR